MKISETSSRILLFKADMGCSPSQPRAAQAKPPQLSAMPSNDQSGTNTPTVPVNAADNRARYDPLQSTSNPTRDVHTQSPTTDSSSASPEAPKQVASVLSTTEVSASGSRPKHTPLARGVRRRNSQRPLRSSAARTRTTDGTDSSRWLRRTVSLICVCWF